MRVLNREYYRVKMLYSMNAYALDGSCYDVAMAKKPDHMLTIQIGFEWLRPSQLFPCFEKEHKKRSWEPSS